MLAARNIDVKDSNLYSIGGDQHNIYVTNNVNSSTDAGKASAGDGGQESRCVAICMSRVIVYTHTIPSS